MREIQDLKKLHHENIVAYLANGKSLVRRTTTRWSISGARISTSSWRIVDRFSGSMSSGTPFRSAKPSTIRTSTRLCTAT